VRPVRARAAPASVATTDEGLTTTTELPLYLPHAEAAALARLAARLDLDDFARLAGPSASYGDRSEVDVMWSGVLILQGALAGAGFMPR
jgi:hypothetical protein